MGCSNPSNLALNQPASQSSTYGVGEALYANDGNTSGTSPWSADLQHTTSEAQPWWEVDLGAISQVVQVKVYNRTDGSQSRLKDFYVLVSDNPFDLGASLDDHLANSSINRTFFSGPAGGEELLNTNMSGRYVRIQLSGNGILHMAEVEVWGCIGGAVDPCQSGGSQNLALGKPAEQSSVYGIGVASIGVDGDTDGTRGPWNNPSILHTQREDQPWWQVDLGAESNLEEVRIYNRTNCCQVRLSDFYILIGSSPFASNASLSSLLSDPSVTSQFYSGAAGDQESIAINASGRFVRIQLSASNEIMHLAEVEVLGCPVAAQGARFSQAYEEPVVESPTPQLSVYPNPTTGKVHIELVNVAPGEVMEYSLYNLTGQLVWSKEGGSSMSTSIQHLPKGIYLLKIQGTDWAGVKQLMLR